ncbi:glycoside hydrolase family 88 protein [Streptomyces sp. NBC_01728]|uniref:glycoside hydrolase family 88 protein n=1 Tax=unclassified Streptomyces TaxID=2593676 RepID=UPI00225025C2|nr:MULTISPECIES: glycoside hydrolase family 88 protein [unclassified Streptomyces]MCX4451767.1 glycoside hydrolase family 88 protein [Streptomyces sp. NBC_01719]MCX4491127.1 glycoside hydrolase family 88 protein [Streptomyces sp. NBC_01728]
MRRRRLLTCGAALTAAAALQPALTGTAQAAPPAGPLPSRGAVVAVLRRVADQWIGAHTDPGDNGWANATFFSGLLALQRLTGSPRYLAYAKNWAEKHAYGLNGGVATRHADNHNAGQAYLDLYEIEPEESKISAIEESLHRMVYTDQPDKNDDWWWDDALHMAMPPFARIGALRGDPQYWQKLYALYDHTKRVEGGPGLYDDATGLWYRDKRFLPGLPGAILSPAGKPVVWSRGNGWVAGGHAKTLKALPPGERHTGEYRDTLVRLVTAVAGIQRTDGFWNVNLADATHLPGPETSGTSFFLYGTSYAMGAGLVDRRAYVPVAARAWNGLVTTAVHPDGFLGYVQNVGDRPESSQPVTYDSTANFGVGAFLLAGTELARLARP